jgi:PEP-CTERM motif-containing protein
MKLNRLLGVAAVCAALGGAVHAAELSGLAPVDVMAFGQQSDAGSGAYSQAFTVPAGSVLEAVRWYGFHGANSLGAAFDNFAVTIGGVQQTGALTVNPISQFFDEYTLDVPDAAFASGSLEIVNDSFDVEWFWQSAAAVGNPSAPDAAAVAFSLIGRVGPVVASVPEPSTLSLLLAIGLGLAGRSKWRATRPCW